MTCSSVNKTDPVKKNGESTSDEKIAIDVQTIGLLSSGVELQCHCALNDRKN